MTKVRLFCLSLLLLIGCFPLLAASVSYPAVGPGINYTCYHMGKYPYQIHVVEIDRAQQDLHITTTLGDGTVAGLVPVSGQVASIPTTEGSPVVGINGDFFAMSGTYQGITSGLQIMNGELVQAPEYGADSVWFDAAGAPQIGWVTSHVTATMPNGQAINLAVNDQDADWNPAIIYTPTFDSSTHTSNGLELVLEPEAGTAAWLPLRVGNTMTARISAINPRCNSKIAAGTMVLYMNPAVSANFQNLQVGMDITINVQTTPDLTGVNTGISGYPSLLVNGVVPTNWDMSDGIITNKHPRSAIGWNGQSIFIAAVDGRQAGLSIGMTVQEWSDFMAQIGCTNAMNLDGGGSTALWVGGMIVNSPSDGKETAVANGVVVYRK